MTKKLNTLTLQATITATSNKQGKYETETPRKSVFFTPLFKEDEQKALDFGLKSYTSQEGDTFFIVKSSMSLSIFVPGQKVIADNFAATVQDSNFKTDVPVKLAILKGHSDMGSDYYRLYALQVPNEQVIKYVTAENPFEQLGDEEPAPTIPDTSDLSF